MENNAGGVVQAIREIEAIIEDAIKGIDADPCILSCFRAYVLNSVALRLISIVRRGGGVDTNRLVSSIIRKALRNKALLISICSNYKELLEGNPSSIVDIGCGLGLNLVISKMCIDTSSLLLGVDKDLYFLKVLRKLLPDVEAVLADAAMLPLRSNSIEIIFSTNVLHELQNLGKVINEISRVLKNCGHSLLMDIIIRGVPSHILKVVRYIRIKLGLEPETPYTLKQIKSVIESSEMRITKLKTYWRLIIMGIAVLITMKYCILPSDCETTDNASST